LTRDEFDALHAADTCPVCGRDMVTRGKRGDAANKSLDQMSPGAGYTTSNCAVICYRCNVLKNDATVQELDQIVAWMRQSAQQPEKTPPRATAAAARRKQSK
jgi:hypothetical protein